MYVPYSSAFAPPSSHSPHSPHSSESIINLPNISEPRLIPAFHRHRSLKMLCLFYSRISFIWSLFASFAFAAKCYNPDGSLVEQPDFQPCVLTSGVNSMCCATNRVSEFADRCLANGLCHNPCKNDDDCTNMPGRYWRESCTDPSWNSPFCLKGICTNKDDSGSFNGTATLSQCATDGRWCCGDLISENCCAMNSRFYLPATIGASSSTSSTFSKPISSITTQESKSQRNPSLDLTSISSSISSSTSTSTSKSSSSHSQAGKSAGLGVGIGVGVLAIGVIIFWFLFRQHQIRSRARQYQYHQRHVEQQHKKAHELPNHGLNGPHIGDLRGDTTHRTPEIDGASIHEIDGASIHEIDETISHIRQDD